MRDDHRPKRELIHEITGLRKQVVDLKEAMAARRRVEDALRAAEALLRSLTDGAPVGLCLFRLDGTLLTANRPFARMLGYDSPAELQAVGAVLGVFASVEERSQAFDSRTAGSGRPHLALFRLKNGCWRHHPLLVAECAEEGAITLAVFDSHSSHGSPPFPSPPA
ncbi:MAG TPA: PAS domain-containing protein [Gemmatimonadales bacterium]|jgi:PAS domain S-box-containing protein